MRSRHPAAFNKPRDIAEPEHGFYLGATLAFITGMPEPYLDKQSLSRLLPEKHNELALLFAKDAVQEREKLEAWGRAHAQRSAAALQQRALERQAKRKWWRFGA